MLQAAKVCQRIRTLRQDYCCVSQDPFGHTGDGAAHNVCAFNTNHGGIAYPDMPGLHQYFVRIWQCLRVLTQPKNFNQL